MEIRDREHRYMPKKETCTGVTRIAVLPPFLILLGVGWEIESVVLHQVLVYSHVPTADLKDLQDISVSSADTRRLWPSFAHVEASCSVKMRNKDNLFT